jgi:hypothetical protein
MKFTLWSCLLEGEGILSKCISLRHYQRFLFSIQVTSANHGWFFRNYKFGAGFPVIVSIAFLNRSMI